ncbi:hypothetical protein DENSPDRAFT_341624 [Dentipellis sp. KUC8613]|nr:hypothetical protein DENSPDRAFT_341624 [Dentipellis sp. KUC8613]
MLDEHHVLAGFGHNSGCFHVDTIAVYDLRTQSPAVQSGADCTFDCAFELPGGENVWAFMARVEPFPGSRHGDFGDNLVTVVLKNMNDSGVSTVMIFFPGSLLRQRILAPATPGTSTSDRSGASSTSSDFDWPQRVYSWEKWGESRVHINTYEDDHPAFRTFQTASMRFADLSTDGYSGKTVLSMYDFHQARVHRVLCDPSAKGNAVYSIRSTPIRARPGSWNAHDVTAGMPYLRTTHQLPEVLQEITPKWHEVVLTEDLIVIPGSRFSRLPQVVLYQ